MSDFVHIHNHSYYSLLDGLAPVEDLVNCASEMGFKSLALTDHGTCAGLYRFQECAKEKGIKPILGTEAYLCDNYRLKEKETAGKNYHLIILAKNSVGYHNLIRLSSLSYIDGFYYKPRLSFELLEKYHEGLIISSACCAGEIPSALWEGNEQKAKDLANKYREVFKDDFYIEIMTHSYDIDKEQEAKEKKLAIQLYKLSRELGIKAICTQDTHYARKEDWEAHDVLLCIQTTDVVKNPDRFTFGSKDFYLKPYVEMAEIYKKAPQLLSNTVEIAEKVETDLIVKGKDLLPTFEVPEGYKDEEAYLKTLVEDGMKVKGLINKPEYRERIRFEMSVIVRCKYTKYFLILWDMINFTKISGIRVGVGRGCFTPKNLVDCEDGKKFISDINIGDKVLSYDGKYHEVLEKMKYDIDEEIIEIEMEDGRKISCTSDHKIHVKRGFELVWIRAIDLIDTDEIYDIRVGE